MLKKIVACSAKTSAIGIDRKNKSNLRGIESSDFDVT